MAVKQQNMYFRKKKPTKMLTLKHIQVLIATHTLIKAVLGIQIRRIRMFLRLPDPHLDPLVTSTDPDTDPDKDPFFIKKKK
jgi:hypothetical protein